MFLLAACTGSKAINWLTIMSIPVRCHLASHPLRGSPFRLKGECLLKVIISSQYLSS
jgi:hypothetical protein